MKTSSRKTRKSAKSNSAQRNLFDSNLFIVPKVKENPRREKTFGHKSMRIILAARKPMQVETFVSKGGRLKDLHWDVDHKHVQLRRKA